MFNSSLPARPSGGAGVRPVAVQPHGVLLVVRTPDLRIVQASTNLPTLLQRPLAWLLDATLRDLRGDIDRQVRALAATAGAADGQSLRCSVQVSGRTLAFDGLLHRGPGGGVLIVELELVDAPAADVGLPQLALLGRAVQALSEAATMPALAATLASSIQQLTGHAQVAVLQLQPDGGCRDMATSLDAPPVDPWPHDLRPHDTQSRDAQSHDPQAHSPRPTQTRTPTPDDTDDGPGDAPNSAPEAGSSAPHPTPPLVAGRLCLIVDAHAVPVALAPGGADAPDVSMCALRAASPQQLRQLQAVGATASLELPLLRGGQLWGLVRCHHHQRLALRPALRAAAELLVEVACTRIAAIQHYGQSQVTAQAMAQVQQLRQRLLDAASQEGDWRPALLRHPTALLQPLNASGAALLHGGHTLSCGTAPGAAGLRALAQWLDQQPQDHGAVVCNALATASPALQALAPEVSGMLALRLSARQPDYLMWFRGPPPQPAPGWAGSDVAIARAFADALVDVAVQVDAVRLLIAEQQVAQLRAAVAGSRQAVVVADVARRGCHANDAFLALAGCTQLQCADLDALAGCFDQPALARQLFGQAQADGRPRRFELALAVAAITGRPQALPVAVRAEPVPARDGALLGLILIFNDLSDSNRADAARRQLEASLSQAGRAIHAPQASVPTAGSAAAPASDTLLAAILTNASLAAMDIAEGGAAPDVAPLLQELQASTERAAALCARIRKGARPA